MTTVYEETTELFHKLTDPKHISDEDFFGVWNSNDKKWEASPILRYDVIAGLSLVSDFAKKGDYAKAKDALVDYYKKRSGVPKYEAAIKPESFLAAEMMRERSFSFLQNDNCVGKTTVSAEWGYYTAELSAAVSTYFLFDADMDGSFLEVYSKENSANKPAILEIEAAGKVLSFEAVADTYISAGENKDFNYGNADILYVREAAGAADMPMSSKTARAYFRFDIGGINEKIDAARLKFYAKNSSGDKNIFVMAPTNERYFDESTLAWSKHFPQIFNFKQTGYIWKEGERKPDSHEMVWGVEYEWLNFVTRLYPSGWCVSKYLATKDEVYAYRAIELLLSMYTAKKSGIYPRILEGGWRTEYLCDVFFGTLDSSHATSEVVAAQLKYMYTHIAELKDVVHAAANWESAIRVGFTRLCAYVPEIVPKGWWEHSGKRLVDLFSRNTLTPSGAYYESCSGYIIGVVNELKLCLNLISAVDGENDEYYIKLLEQYKRLTSYYFNSAMNCGCTIPWGDGGRADIKAFAAKENEFYHNPYFEYFATDGKLGAEPDYYSVLYPDKAIAFMRSDWKRDGLSAVINADFGGNHAHYDDLALDVCAYGSLLLVDVGNGSYSPGSLLAEVRAKTISHNTIEIDGEDQRVELNGPPGHPGVPQRLELTSNRLFDFVDAGSEMIYPGFSVNRKVLFLHFANSTYWIVSDFIIPSDSNPHKYRQAWHPDAKNGITVNDKDKTAVTHYEKGANIYILPAEPKSLNAKVAKTYMMHPVYRETEEDFLIYARENAVGAQAFDTVLYPVRKGETASVGVEKIFLENASALKININGNIGCYYSSNEKKAVSREFCEYSFDGQMAYIEKDIDGKISLIAIKKGRVLKELKEEKIELVRCETKLNDLGISFENERIQIFSEKGILPNGIKIHCESRVTSVTLNQKEIDFSFDESASVFTI